MSTWMTPSNAMSTSGHAITQQFCAQFFFWNATDLRSSAST